jgi:hypothetical protein
MTKAVLPSTNIRRNKAEEKKKNLRRMEVWRLWETGIENMLLYTLLRTILNYKR